jgi:hypothetical protein
MAQKITSQGESLQKEASPKSDPAAVRPKPMVFISHDSRDADIAEAFANLLQDASGGVLRSFRSSDRKGTAGIEFGAEWYSAIMEKLKDATDVVALLTSQSLGRPWLLYEAGVAKGRLDTVVFGVALGVPLENVGIGPFAQFQNSGDDEDSLTKLVLQLIRRNPDADPREAAVRRQVRAFRETSSQILARRPDPAATARPAELDASAVARLFEEVKVMFRQLPDQLELSLERRLSGMRPPLSLPVGIDDSTISRLYHLLLEAPPGDDAGWREVAGLARAAMPGSIHRHLTEMRDAWRKEDTERIGVAGDRLRRVLSARRQDLSHLPHEYQEHLRDLVPMLLDVLERIEAQPVSGTTRSKKADAKSRKSD